MKVKSIVMIIIIIGIVLVITGIIWFKTKETVEQHIDPIEQELNDVVLQTLILEMEKYLPAAQDIENYESYTLDQMIAYAFSYTGCLNENKVSIDDVNAIGIANTSDIVKNIEYIFGISNIDLIESNYEIKNGKIYVPLNLQGGDAQVYKLVGTVESEEKGEYITTIDCLGITSPDDVSNLLTKTEYDKDNVIYTLKIRYKAEGNRKILLTYTAEVNI